MQAYAKTHGGALPSPALVKQIIVSTAQDLGAPADHQGAGLVNTLKAVQLAESINGGSPQGNTLLVRQTALSGTVDAGQTQGFSVNVTNEGGERPDGHAVDLGPADDAVERHRQRQPERFLADVHRR